MKTFAKGIVKIRYALMVFFVVAAAVCGYLITKVQTNYDIIKYLPTQTDTVLALNEMEKQFGSVGTAQLMVKMDAGDVAGLKSQLEEVKGMQAVVASGTDEATYREGYALFKLFLKDSSFEPGAKDAIREVRTLLTDYEMSAMNGSAVSSMFLQDGIASDMVLILIIACIIIAIILLITSTSWVDPLIFGFVVAVSLLINLGTNAILPEVSFITKAICAIMQLALAMDYSIILLHRFNEERERSLSDKDAMIAAISGSFTSVAASSLTTIAGLVALMFMKFTIGLDVGIVLTKGIVISLLTVFFFMPGVILMFSPAISKTRHKSLHQTLTEKSAKSNEKRQARYDAEADKTGVKPKKAMTYIDFVFKTRKIVPVVVILLLAAGMIMNFNVKYSFQLETSKNPGDAVNVENAEIEKIFGKQNSLVVLVPTGDAKKEQELVDFMMNYTYKGEKVINGEQGMAAMGFYTEIPTATLRKYLADADVDELLTRCGLATDAPSMKIYDIIKLLSNAKIHANGILLNPEMTYLAGLVKRAVRVGINVLDLLGDKTNPSVYNAEELSEALTVAISPLVPKLTVTAETIGKLYTKLGKTPDDYITLKVLLTEMSNQKIAAELIENETISGLLQTVLDVVAPLTDSVHNLITPTDVGVLLPVEGIGESIGNLYNQYGKRTASIYQILQMFAGIVPQGGVVPLGGLVITSNVACATIISKVSPLVDLAFTMFESEGGMSRLMFNLNMTIATDDSFAAMKEITDGVRAIYAGTTVYIACETAAYSSIKDIFTIDSMTINLISFFAIFIIVLLAFRSFGVPAILTLLIQGATWMGMAFQFMAGTTVFFVCYLVVTCIQMGATVDYAILITNRYIENRYTMNRVGAMKKAFSSSVMTIATSGSILVIAAFLVGMVSKVAIIADLGVMLAIGCLISLSIILFGLPQILMWADKFIEKTSLKKKGQSFVKDTDEKKHKSNDPNDDDTIGGINPEVYKEVPQSGAAEIEGLREAGVDAITQKTLCGLTDVRLK